MPGAMDKVRVLDLSTGIAGAVAGMVLADHGALVTKVEPLTGDTVRDLDGWLVWHRGKRSLAMDVEKPAGREALLRLLPDADVLLESYPPGTMAGMGLGYESLAPTFRSLIYASFTGYGQQGRDRHRSAYGELVEARLGLQYEQAGYRDGPIYLGWPLAEYGGAFLLAIGTVTALYARTVTGRGQHVETSLKDGVAFLVGSRWAQVEKGKPAGGRGRETGLRKALGNTRHVVGVFRCSDGGWVHIHTAPRGGFNRLMRCLGLMELVDPARDNESQPSPLSQEVADKMWADVERTIGTRPRDEWVRILRDADLPVMQVTPPGDCFDDEQLNANELIIDVQDPDLGLVREVGIAQKFSRTPGRVSGSAPRLGQDTDTVLETAGYTQQEIEAMRRDGVVL